MISTKLSDCIAPAFRDWYRETKKDTFLRFVLKGGRGSGKSTHIALKLVLDIKRFPISALCVRRVGNTLMESCYEQIKEAVYQLHLEREFRFYKSPLRVVYIPRGNSFIFRGADDPMKIKSIKISQFPIARLWVEELAEFRLEEDVRVIENSVLRGNLPGGVCYQLIYSYNPPKRKQSWVNKAFDTQFLPPNTTVHHSTYLDNPFISATFIEEAEYEKKRRPLRYEWEYLGNPIGAGVVPFDNLVFERISDDAVAQFDNIRQGIDWGYANDPVHFTRCHYDKKKRRIYIFDEIHRVKLSNRLLAEELFDRGYQDVRIYADSAEPKSIDELYDYGFQIEGAYKGAGSVEYGEKWLDDLDAIIIDPDRCPETAREFESIDYQMSRDGKPLNRLEDEDNHSIDALRYAMNRDMEGRRFEG